MRTIRKLTAAGAVAAAGLAFSASPASAQDLTCTGTVGAVTVDNVVVPAFATCTLDGTRVNGSVEVEAGGALRATRVNVAGSIQATDHRFVVVAGSRLGGSIQLDNGGRSTVRNTTLAGDIQVVGAAGGVVLDRNRVSGSIELKESTGGATVTLNQLTGNLNCQDNLPAPTGFGNVAVGSLENQCAGL
jgi:hypothetical protein